MARSPRRERRRSRSDAPAWARSLGANVRPSLAGLRTVRCVLQSLAEERRLNTCLVKCGQGQLQKFFAVGKPPRLWHWLKGIRCPVSGFRNQVPTSPQALDYPLTPVS